MGDCEVEVEVEVGVGVEVEVVALVSDADGSVADEGLAPAFISKTRQLILVYPIRKKTHLYSSTHYKP